MASFSFLFPILTLLFLISCQVKEGASSGGLIAGHVPTTNKFTIQTPPTKTYVEAETLTLTVSFPFPIVMDTTGGSPRLRLTVGAATRYATFVSQPVPTQMTFTYVIAAGDNDTNGVDVAALELNGSTLTFDKDGVPTNCDVTTLTNKNVANVKVDTAVPTITDFDLMNLPGLYNEGERLNFAMTFSEAVTVVGSPKFSITLSGNTVDAVYSAGSGSNVLTFAYTVGATDADSNGYDAIISPIDLVGGSIKDAVGNDSSLDFSTLVLPVITYSNNVDINGSYPFVTNVILPLNGTYVAADELDFVLEFDRAVNVSGIPYLNVVIGSNTRQAQYLSGSGTEQITFRYTAVPGDVDTDGISVTGSIVQNSGNIIDATPGASYFTDAQNNAFVIPNTTGIRLNAIQPQATSVARNVDSTLPVWGGSTADNIWIIGQELNITVGFNTGMFVTQTSGTPSISLTIGATAREATYLSGGNGQSSLVFRYVIQEGDLDSDGTIALGNINLNGGVITDAANTNTLLTLPVAGLSTTRIDGVRPVISSVTPPANATYSQVAPQNAAAMSFVVNWSEAVNYSTTTTGSAYLSMDIGGTTVNAEYATGVNSAAVTHRPSSLANRNDSNGVVLNSPLAGTATIRDQAGNTASVFTYTAPNTTAVLVDTTAPTVTNISATTANGTYKAGQTLDFAVTFSESVTTTVTGGYPRIPITIGSTVRYLTPTANTTNTTHTFRYTIVTGDLDDNGVVTGTSVTSSGTGHIRDGGRNNVTGTFTAPNTSNIRVDAVAPTLDSSTVSANKAYVSGESIQITVTYSEIVNVDTTNGTPSIAVDFDFGTDNLIYSSGSGTTTLTFSRTLNGTHFDMNGLNASVTTIALNSGTIQDVSGNDAPLVFTAKNMSQIYVTYAQVKIWAKNDFVNIAPPVASSISATGVATTEACGSSVCRTFNGDDSLSMSAPMTNIRHALIVAKMPSSVSGLENFDLFDVDLSLRGDFLANGFDLNSANATIVANGGTSSGVNHDFNFTPASTHVIQVAFTSTQNFSGTLIESAFTGAIGEVIAVEDGLTGPQIDNIRNYLESKY